MCAAAAGGCGGNGPVALPDGITPETLALAGEFHIPSGGRFPPVIGLPFGGLSGLAPFGDGRWFAICDERDGGRMYRLRITGEGPSFQVTPEEVIGLETGGSAPARIDGEAIVVTPNGTLIVASEGAGNQQPRIPPALVEYDKGGAFLRQLELPERFLPNLEGPLTRGMRDNAALESLGITPGGGRLFTGTETALVQDGLPAGIGRGTVARILEYTREDDTYRPAREFAYEVEPVEAAPFPPAVTVSGLVELVALTNETLLALERTYIAEKRGSGEGGPSLNRIRLYRLTLGGATDVSRLDSLAGVTFTPVHKTLLLDLSQLKGLSPELATLENFEGLSIGPMLADGSPSLLLVSDDNFHETQRTSFLLFRVVRGK